MSIERRAQVIELHEAGNSMRAIFLQLHIPRSIEQEIISRFRNPRNFRSRHFFGRPRVTYRHVDKLMKRLYLQNPHITASKKIQAKIASCPLAGDLRTRLRAQLSVRELHSCVGRNSPPVTHIVRVFLHLRRHHADRHSH